MQSVASKPKKVACPTCGEMVEYRTDKAWRPFCSQRCKLIDLGQWATESYRIPEKEQQLPEDPGHE